MEAKETKSSQINREIRALENKRQKKYARMFF
jgi:hypothetical protein